MIPKLEPVGTKEECLYFEQAQAIKSFKKNTIDFNKIWDENLSVHDMTYEDSNLFEYNSVWDSKDKNSIILKEIFSKFRLKGYIYVIVYFKDCILMRIPNQQYDYTWIDKPKNCIYEIGKKNKFYKTDKEERFKYLKCKLLKLVKDFKV